MTIPTGQLYLGSTQKRRVGLTKGGYQHAPLLRSLNASTNKSPAPMAPKTAAKPPTEEVKKSPIEEESEDVFRAPESESDDDLNADIAETQFVPGSANLDGSVPESKPSPSGRGEVAAKGAKKHGNPLGIRKGTRNTKLPLSSSSSSISSSGSTKRKGEVQRQQAKPGSAATDMFGSVLVRPGKKPRKKYGTKPELKLLVTKKKVKGTLKSYSPAEESPQKSATAKRLEVAPELETSPESTPKKSGLKRTADLDSPVSTKKEAKSLKKYDLDDLSDSDDDSTKQATKKLRIPGLDETPEMPKAAFKAYSIGLEPDLVSKAKSLVDKDRDELDPLSQSMDDYDFSTMTQRACCPMCGATVDFEDLRAHSKNGVMNIRTQEKFCRAHKTRTAQNDWEIKDYPTIDWDALDSRITKHHAFIEELINGQYSYYRDLMDETVLGGKDRNLLKMTSNLTPGYYGARGLRIFSENIMENFTPLLQKRLPEDPVMSARGPAAYVQSVLVPEIAVRLIMEDMKVEVEEGRQILDDSVNAGELLNEEIKDVVTRKVMDSEGEDDSD